MRRLRLTLLSVAAMCSLLLAVPGFAQSPPQGPEQTAIRALLGRQQDDWNRGDLDAFATGYKNSPDILFIGPSGISKGYDGMLSAYHARYKTHQAMGTLTFSGLEVQPLDSHFATATGHFHLARTASAGGGVFGHFLLVLEKTPEGWKIVRDDTATDPAHR